MTTPSLATIVDEVVALADRRAEATSLADLERRARQREYRGFARGLAEAPFSIISEMKRASPSAGSLREDLVPSELARDYQSAGARALSVLCCPPYFHGRLEDLAEARAAITLPVLCKDFLVKPFQILEAVAGGADAVLLIAAALDDGQLQELTRLSRDLGVDILFEVHDAAEIERVLPLDPELLGVNSRNLRTMTIDPETPERLAPLLPRDSLRIYESGIKTPEDARRAARLGYRAALIGESLVRAEDPAAHLASLVDAATRS